MNEGVPSEEVPEAATRAHTTDDREINKKEPDSEYRNAIFITRMCACTHARACYIL